MTTELTTTELTPTTESTPSTDWPDRRVVLLGASNLIRGISFVVETACQAWGRPLDFVAALGHGRSYSRGESRVLMRVLPGILSCGIWKAIDDRPPARTATLLTDIGNDLLYGCAVDQIASWVEQCLEKTARISEKTALTELPIESVKRLGRRRFTMLRTMLFPSSRLQFRDAIDSAFRLNEIIVELGARYRATVVKPRSEWFGFDPIHIKSSAKRKAWQEIISAWGENELAHSHHSPSITRWLRLRMLRPAQRRLFGVTQRKQQPAMRFSDGTCISIY